MPLSSLALNFFFFPTWLSRRQLLCRKRRMRIGACISSALLNRRKNRPIGTTNPIRQVDKTSSWLLVEMRPSASGDERRHVNRRLARHMRHPPAPSHVRTPLSRTNRGRIRRARIRRCVSASPVSPSAMCASPPFFSFRPFGRRDHHVHAERVRGWQKNMSPLRHCVL